MNTIGISLGWNCSSAVWAVNNGIRTTKNQGYNTCPFDEMMSNYRGIIECISTDFADFTNSDYLEVNIVPPGLPYVNYSDYCNEIILNTKYNFAFNHESPGHPFLPSTQNWGNNSDKYHYTKDYFHFFKERYNRRIANFLNYLRDPNNKIIFVLSRYNTTLNDVQDLRNVLTVKYPLLSYEIQILDTDKNQSHNNYLFMGLMEDDEEVKRTA